MARIALPGRLAAILLVALLAGLVTLAALGYLAGGLGRSAALPAPERLEALARVVERTPLAERASLLEAVTAPGFAVSVLPGQPAARAGPEPALTEVERRALARYDALAARRPLVVRPADGPGPARRFAPRGPDAASFRLGLDTGETLYVRAEHPVALTPFGLPVGFGAALAGTLIALVTLVLLHREFRPLMRLARALERLGPGDGPVDLPPIRARSREMKALVAAFERLQERIATLIHARLALVGGIQHDLRTFATRLRLRIDGIADPGDRARAAADIDDMIALMDDALLASRAGARELDEELVDLAALAAAETADRAAAGAPVRLAPAGGAGEIAVLGDRLALRRVVANLVDNALRYGGRADLALRVEDGEAVLTVDDRGPGIPAADRALLLEPFTRAEASRARRTGGAGLGLAVVRSLVEAHGGRVAIADAPGGGARLEVRLPRFTP